MTGLSVWRRTEPCVTLCSSLRRGTSKDCAPHSSTSLIPSACSEIIVCHRYSCHHERSPAAANAVEGSAVVLTPCHPDTAVIPTMHVIPILPVILSEVCRAAANAVEGSAVVLTPCHP